MARLAGPVLRAAPRRKLWHIALLCLAGASWAVVVAVLAGMLLYRLGLPGSVSAIPMGG